MINAKHILIVGVIVLVALLAGCTDEGSNRTGEGGKSVEALRSKYTDEIEGIIKGDINTSITTEKFRMDDNDVIQGFNVGEVLINDNAIYIRVSTNATEHCMYRFQLNNEGKIESYIKFKLDY